MLMREDAPQRHYPLGELFKALRYIVRCGCQWESPQDKTPGMKWRVTVTPPRRQEKC